MHRHCSFAAFALLAALPLAPTANADGELNTQKLRRASSLSARGTKALKLGDWGEAERRFRAALEAVPIYPDAHVGLGQLAMREGRFAEALESFERARDGYIKMQGYVFAERMKNHDEAQRRLAPMRSRLAGLRQLQGRPASDSAQVALEIARLEQQIVHLEQVHPPMADEIPGIPAELHFFLANAQMRLGRVDDAIENWEAAVQDDPGFAAAYNNLAIAHARKGDAAEAMRCIERAEKSGLEVPAGLKSEIERLSREAP